MGVATEASFRSVISRRSDLHGAGWKKIAQFCIYRVNFASQRRQKLVGVHPETQDEKSVVTARAGPVVKIDDFVYSYR